MFAHFAERESGEEDNPRHEERGKREEKKNPTGEFPRKRRQVFRGGDFHLARDALVARRVERDGARDEIARPAVNLDDESANPVDGSAGLWHKPPLGRLAE